MKKAIYNSAKRETSYTPYPKRESRGTGILFKPLIFKRNADNLFITPYKATFKYDEKSNRLNMDGQGKFLFFFYTVDAELKVMEKTKNNFQVYMRNLKEILPIEPFRPEFDIFKKEMTYGENTQSNKILTISKESAQPNIKINLMSNVGGEQINSNIEISKGQFIMMRDLFKFCVPLFAGWQGFMNEDMILKEHGLN